MGETCVITEPCIGVKSGDCVDVCPVDCIRPSRGEAEFETAQMLYIDRETCIGCGACESACPVAAIFEWPSVPDKWKSYIEVNDAHFRPAAREAPAPAP